MQLWLIPLLPLAGFAINGLFGRRFSKALVNVFAIGSVVLAFAWVLKTIVGLGDLTMPYTEHYFTWIQSGQFSVGADFTVDRLTEVMLLVVTGIGSLIHIYSTGYMAHEHGPNHGGYYRFFAYLNLFMFFMLVLVLAANYLVLFVGWEGVGLCSYLLIGFYFTKKFATDAGNKAFIVNRIGDFGFSLAMFYIVKTFGTLDFGSVFSHAPGASEATLTLIGLLLLVGATGKSAQIPLYVWLPDAMAGPTPVSALIHAATMVTAGVYMTARSFPIYSHAPVALETIAVIGVATAFFAATIGMAQNDIKKVFAYSTVSQLGYMFVGVGVGAYGAGVYHLVTHAFFKALLFLGSGAVIHSLSGEQDMRNMGGLRTKIPWTFWTMVCAWVAIAGVPFFSGFYSKDAILSVAYSRAPWMFWLGAVTAGITAFYVFRAFFLAFYGTYRGHQHPHESPRVMTIPLIILAILSVGGGYIPVLRWLSGPSPEVALENRTAMIISVAFGILGILAAWLVYVARPALAETLQSAAGPLYTLVFNKYYVDEIYQATVVRPLQSLARLLLWRGVEEAIIDNSFVNGLARAVRNFGGLLRWLQSGSIRNYATWVLAGSLLVIFVIGLAGGAR